MVMVHQDVLMGLNCVCVDVTVKPAGCQLTAVQLELEMFLIC